MIDEPLVWRYGLMAERWAEFIHDAREVPFFLQAIARYGQPVLDMAGFREIVVCGDYTDDPAIAEHANLVFIAIR